MLPDGTKADYVLNDRHGRAMAVLEAKRTSVSLAAGEAQAVAYAKQLKVPFVFLANGEEVRVWEWEREAYPRVIKTVYRQDDLERHIATLTLRRDARTIPIDTRIVERPYQHECIDALTEEIQRSQLSEIHGFLTIGLRCSLKLPFCFICVSSAAPAAS